MDPLQQWIAQWKPLAEGLLDSYFIVDNERTIVEFNRTFFSMLPRQTARGLKGKHCYDVLKLSICKDACIAEQCWRDKKHVRLSEIDGSIAGAGGGPDGKDKPLRFLLSGIPIYGPDGAQIGALEIQRDVTDEAAVQGKYQEMLDNEARERERLVGQIKVRTKELVETNRLLLETQRELGDLKKGISG